LYSIWSLCAPSIANRKISEEDLIAAYYELKENLGCAPTAAGKALNQIIPARNTELRAISRIPFPKVCWE